MAAIFTKDRLLVGYRQRDWSEVWYEPVKPEGEEGEEKVPKTEGTGPELGIYMRFKGEAQKREPMVTEVKWLPHFDPKSFEAEKATERKAMHRQFLADAYKYMSEKNPEVVAKIEESLDQPRYTRWFKWFEVAKKVKRSKMKGRKQKRQERESTAAAAGLDPKETDINSDSSDSGFEGEDEELQNRVGRAVSDMPPPPRPQPIIKGKGKGKRKASTKAAQKNRQPKHKRRRMEDRMVDEDDGDEDGDEEDDAPSMSGARGSSLSSSDWRHSSSSRLETTSSGNTRDLFDDIYSEGHPSPAPEGNATTARDPAPEGNDTTAGDPRQLPTPNTSSRLRSFDLWGGGAIMPTEGEGGWSIQANTSQSQQVDVDHYTAATENLHGEVNVGLNDGLNDDEAFERAVRESMAPEDRLGVDTTSTNAKAFGGVHESIEIEDHDKGMDGAF